MNTPPLNASDKIWHEWLNTLNCPHLLAAWCWLAEHGCQRHRDMALLVAGSRYFTIAMRASIIEAQLAELPCTHPQRSS